MSIEIQVMVTYRVALAYNMQPSYLPSYGMVSLVSSLFAVSITSRERTTIKIIVGRPEKEGIMGLSFLLFQALKSKTNGAMLLMFIGNHSTESSDKLTFMVQKKKFICNPVFHYFV